MNEQRKIGEKIYGDKIITILESNDYKNVFEDVEFKKIYVLDMSKSYNRTLSYNKSLDEIERLCKDLKTLVLFDALKIGKMYKEFSIERFNFYNTWRKLLKHITIILFIISILHPWILIPSALSFLLRFRCKKLAISYIKRYDKFRKMFSEKIITEVIDQINKEDQEKTNP